MLKSIFSLAILSALMFAPAPSFAGLPDLDDESVRDEVDVRAFVAGADSHVGNLIYIVDRTTGFCFAGLRSLGTGAGIGLTAISCKPLEKIPAIEHYIKTGKVK